jgi:hypothetical protein
LRENVHTEILLSIIFPAVLKYLHKNILNFRGDETFPMQFKQKLLDISLKKRLNRQRLGFLFTEKKQRTNAGNVPQKNTF